jgi:hypothetical protein
MRVTVIFDDVNVYVDGVARGVTMPAHDENWRAVQWYGAEGNVEVRIGSAFHISDVALIAPFVAAWEAAAPPPPAQSSGAPAGGVQEL